MPLPSPAFAICLVFFLVSVASLARMLGSSRTWREAVAASGEPREKTVLDPVFGCLGVAGLTAVLVLSDPSSPESSTDGGPYGCPSVLASIRSGDLRVVDSSAMDLVVRTCDAGEALDAIADAPGDLLVLGGSDAR